MATFLPKMAFINVDFPTLGWPTRATNPDDNSGDELEVVMCYSLQKLNMRWFSALLLALLICLAGCDDAQETETSMFEAAEIHYRQGNYTEALSGYHEFLQRFPASPLTNTAELRMRNIHREVSSMMERPGSPRPVYHGFDGDQSTSPQEGEADHIHNVDNDGDLPAGDSSSDPN